ncbi:MAG: bifunctional hydroxymethylpyrimidine kinase/phosphomethylpyrimidine kinase [Clostridia bacterium]|nr:bifunctional hydroxymethylpyrimidine kinase/phosphomethylpyrimidine kinase [Clostridia bacterium]
MKTVKTVLTIAGSDSVGGAGIQADIKTMTMNGTYAMSAVTAVTAQNTLGVTAVTEMTPEMLAAQLDAVFCDIFPDAVKTGMIPSGELMEVAAEKLSAYGARNIVVDPVMVATAGSRLMKNEAVSVMENRLLPLALLVTPNIPEAEVLSGLEIRDAEDMKKAAEAIYSKCGCSVLVKGGHSINDATDYLYDGRRITEFRGRRIDNPNTHGTGCTLSSAIAANLAKGFVLETAIINAKKYITAALEAGLDLGKGRGPLLHNYCLPDLKDKDENERNAI